MLKKDRTLFFNQSLQRDPHQQLMGSILGLDPSSIYCVILLTNQPTNKQKDTGENITSLLNGIINRI